MRELSKWLAIIASIEMFVIISSILLSLSCAPVLSPQPIIHPEAGTHLMLIPRGTKIGGQLAPENGIYIGESLTRPPQEMQEQQEPKREKLKT